MIVIEEYPTSPYFLENELFFRISNDVKTSLRLSIDNESESSLFYGFPDAENKIRFQHGLHKFVRSRFGTVKLPNLINNEWDVSANLLATLHVTFEDDDENLDGSDLRVFKGLSNDPAQYLDTKFLWLYEGPRNIPMKYGQDAVMYFYISGTQNEQLRLVIDNQVPQYISLTGVGEQNILHVSPAKIEALFSVDLSGAKKYSLAVEAEETGNPSTSYDFEALTFWLDHAKYTYQRSFIFQNPMGAMEILHCHGKQQLVSTFEKELAEQNPFKDDPKGDKLYFDNETTRTVEQSTGTLGKFAREWHEYLECFFESNRVYEIRSGKYQAVIIKPLKYLKSSDELRVYGFTFEAEYV